MQDKKIFTPKQNAADAFHPMRKTSSLNVRYYVKIST
jgi:hypothetical protein